MNIRIRKLDISINTKFLSGGEVIFVKRLAKKSKQGNALNFRESNFLLSMSRRSEAFSQFGNNKVDVELFLN